MDMLRQTPFPAPPTEFSGQRKDKLKSKEELEGLMREETKHLSRCERIRELGNWFLWTPSDGVRGGGTVSPAAEGDLTSR